MSAQLTLHKNPFRVHLDVEQSLIVHGKTVREVLQSKKLLSKGGRRLRLFVVFYEGQPLLQKDWNLIVRQDAHIQVSFPPRGGGGSNVGAILAGIAASVMAYFTFGLSLVASAAIGVAAYAGMTLLYGAIPKPTTTTVNTESTSPTYSLNNQGNVARLGQAMPRVYGRMKTFPDLAAAPYTEFESNLQYLYQLFYVSSGKAHIESIFLDDTTIDQFSDAQVQIVYPGEAVTLFPDNVVTSDAVNGQEALAPNNPNFAILGPYTVNAAGTTVSRLAVDVTLPQGAAVLDDNGDRQNHTVGFMAQYRAINDAGVPIGAWTTLTQQNLTFATQQPQSLTFAANVPDGRYQVQLQRITNEGTDTRTIGSLVWQALRGYMPSTHVYGDATLIAVKMRATSLLNSSTARKFSVISQGYVPVWDPVNGWSQPQYSASPAWIAADILRNTTYGRGLPTSRLNIEKLYALAATWAARGDEFNGVFDSTLQLWEALSRVLRVGRAVPIYYAGVIDFIRDEPQTIPRAMFQPSNMVQGSFKAVYNFFKTDTPDHVIVKYIDRTTWTQETVECVLPGGTTKLAGEIELFGCTSRDQAWREGMSIAAGNRDRRRSIEFQTNQAGLIPTYNSLVRVSHDSVAWGYSGRVISLNRVNGTIVVSERIRLEQGQNHVINFRKRNGSQDGPYPLVASTVEAVPGVGFQYRVNASAAQLAPIYISDGSKEDLTFYQAGVVEREGLLALVTGISPREDGSVSINCINYATSVYSAESGGVVPPPPPASNLPAETSRPVVDSVDVRYTTTVGEQNIVATPATGAIYYEFEAQRAGTQWTQLGTSADPTLRSNLAPGVWSIRVRGVGRGQGPWATWNGTILATTIALPRLDAFTGVPKLFAIGLQWSFAAETLSIADKVELRVGATAVLGNSLPLATLPYPANNFTMDNLGPGEWRYFWARVIDKAGRAGPWFNNTYIYQRSENDATVLLDYLVGKITRTQLGQDLLEEIDEIPDLIDKLAQLEIDFAQLESLVDGLAIKDYSASETYLKDALVISAGKMYQAVQNVPAGNAPPNVAYWKYIGEFTTLADGLAGLAAQVTTLTQKVTNAEVMAREVWVMQAEIRKQSAGQLASVLDQYRMGASIQVLRQTVVDLDKALAQQVTTLRSEFQNANAVLQEGLLTVTTAQTAQAQRLLQLESRMTYSEEDGTKQGQSIAQLQTNTQTLADGQTALSQEVTTLKSTVQTIDNNLGTTQTNVAQLQTSVQTLATQQEASATAITTLQAQVTQTNADLGTTQTNVATLQTQYNALATEQTATAQAVTTLISRVNGNDSSIAALQTDYTTLATAQGATATALTALTSDYNTNKSSVAVQLQTLSDAQGTTATQVTNLQSSVATAQSTADGKGKIIWGSSTPAAADRLPQNLWIDTTGNANTPKRWDGSNWVVATDKVATDAATAASNANAAALAASGIANSKGKVIIQNAEPATEERLAQNLWIDTTGGANTPKTWNGTAWTARTDKTATDAAAAAVAAQTTANTANGKADANTAAISQTNTTVATIDGKVSTSTVVRHQVTADGKTYAAGFAIGLDYSGGTVQSQFLVNASTFAVLNQINGTTSASSPFIVENGIVYMNVAIIKEGSIHNALIGRLIQSDNYISGVQGWRIDKWGGIEVNGVGPGGGRTQVTSNGVTVWWPNGNVCARLGFWG